MLTSIQGKGGHLVSFANIALTKQDYGLLQKVAKDMKALFAFHPTCIHQYNDSLLTSGIGEDLGLLCNEDDNIIIDD